MERIEIHTIKLTDRDAYYSIKELGEFLNISRQRIYVMETTHSLPPTTVVRNGRRYWLKTTIQDMIND